MILGYGQDDKVCALTSLFAMLEAENPERTGCCILADKEEIGNMGETGMQSSFFEDMVSEILALTGEDSPVKVRRVLRNSCMLSSDVSAAYDPLYPEVFEKKNTAYFGRGLVLNKYTGSRGKNGTSDANAEYVAKVRNVFGNNHVAFQTAELGKVDQGGGGTIAYVMANKAMSVIDSGVIMSGLLGGSASTYTFVINMLLLVVAFVLLGKEVAMRSAYVSVLYSVTLEVIQYVWSMSGPLTNQPVLELVFCFMILAVCSAIFFNMDASSGGSDIIALVLKKYTNVSIGTALLVVDFIVVIVAFFVYGVTVGLFSLAGFLAKSFFIDTVIETLNLCKYFTIISKNAEPICNYINTELNHGATIYDARGAYTKDNKQAVMTVVKREQARSLRNYVHEVDPDAFMMITNSSEIIGKGFIE